MPDPGNLPRWAGRASGGRRGPIGDAPTGTGASIAVMITPPLGTGRATRAVLEEYQRGLDAHRRWTIATKVTTVVLVAATVLTMVVTAVAVFGILAPWWVSVSPIPLLAAWLLWHDEITALLGRAGEPQYPRQMLELAARTDAAETSPRVFGSVPATMRVYRPDER